MKIKNVIAIVAVGLLAAGTCKAQSSSNVDMNSRLCYDSGSSCLFNASEFSLDLFGAYISDNRKFNDLFDTSQRNGDWGGGVGVNYFFTRILGAGVDAFALANGGAFVDVSSASLIARLPLDSAHLAPYAFGGGGYNFGPDSWLLHAGAGLEFRLNRYTGIFTDVRYNWAARDHVSDFALFRAGVRVSF